MCPQQWGISLSCPALIVIGQGYTVAEEALGVAREEQAAVGKPCCLVGSLGRTVFLQGILPHMLYISAYQS